MSVVNKMLRDLEARQTSSPLTASYQPPAKSRFTRSGVAVITLFLVLSLGGALWFSSQPPASASGVQVQPINKAAAAAVQDLTVTADAQKAEIESERSLTDYNLEKQSSGLKVQLITQQNDEQLPLSEEPVVQNAGEQPEPAIEENKVLTNARPEPVSQPSAPTAGTMSVTANAGAGNDPAQKLREQIHNALGEHQNTRAIGLLQRLVKLEPDNLATRKKLAAMQYAEGQVLEAQQGLMAAIRLFPQDDSLRLMLARLLRQQNQTSQAYEVLQQASGTVGEELLGYRAALAQETGAHDAALSDYRLLTQRDKSNAKWWLGMAVVADKQGDPDLAMQAYQQAAGLNQLSEQVQTFVRQRLNALKGGAQ